MVKAEELARENEALRELLSRLSRASLRINEGLDFDTVLQVILDSACLLTGARVCRLRILCKMNLRPPDVGKMHNACV